MATGLEPSTQAGEAYDALASGYDTLTRDYAYDRWLPALEQLAHDHGLAGHRVLDVACGTGESFLPLRARGYEVTGCDISAEMLGRARRKAPDVLLHHLDMRELPVLGSFDLVTCIDDGLNYLLEEHERPPSAALASRDGRAAVRQRGTAAFGCPRPASGSRNRRGTRRAHAHEGRVPGVREERRLNACRTPLVE